ncbi:MAG: hypothetical protein J0M12_13325 [Deltaproteobacteria bacterium]|nr:hypothetical protein [Deltaproteobacteria bacterium]
MPLPPILKVLWFGKYLIYPFVDSIREWRSTKDPSGRNRFWHHPLEAVADRRLRVKLVTNVAEVIVHAVGSLRFGYGFLSRRFRRYYRTWSPEHRHEHELYAQVEHKPWSDVFRESFVWLRAALHFYEEPRLDRPKIVDLFKRSKRWKRVAFDGFVVAVCVPRGKPPVHSREYARPDSVRRLRILFGESNVFELVVVEHGRIVQHLQVFELAVCDLPVSVGG